MSQSFADSFLDSKINLQHLKNVDHPTPLLTSFFTSGGFSGAMFIEDCGMTTVIQNEMIGIRSFVCFLPGSALGPTALTWAFATGECGSESFNGESSATLASYAPAAVYPQIPPAHIRFSKNPYLPSGAVALPLKWLLRSLPPFYLPSSPRRLFSPPLYSLGGLLSSFASLLCPRRVGLFVLFVPSLGLEKRWPPPLCTCQVDFMHHHHLATLGSQSPLYLPSSGPSGSLPPFVLARLRGSILGSKSPPLCLP